MRTARLNSFRQPRGSVLIMALMMLVLMAGIVTAFLLSVRQQSKVATNAAQASQADGASKAALSHGLSLLRQACQQYEIFTPDGVWLDGSAPVIAGHPYVDPSPLLPCPFRVVEVFTPGEMTANATIVNAQGHAWLYYDNSGANVCGVTSLETFPANALYFTDSPLTNFNEPNGQKRQNFTNGPEHAGLARKFQVFPDSTRFVNQLYLGAPANVTHNLPRPTSVRGEYYLWIDDLDAKLHANPQEWGLDAFCFAGEPSIVNTLATISTSKQIYTAMSSYGDGHIFTAGPDGAAYNGMKLDDSLQTQLSTRSLAQPYSNCGDVAMFLLLAIGGTVPSSGDPGANAYLAFRYGLERYFTVLKDNGAPTYVKNHPAALNINTASVETIAGALSRVPLVPGYDIHNAVSVQDNVNVALAFAKRICAKRPFLCRVDFEDFVAAQVNKDPTGAPDDIADPTTPVGMINAAILKRDYSGTTLADLLEIPNVPDTNPVYQKLRNPVWVQQRFQFFRANDAVAPLLTAQIYETSFNNVLNSIFGKKRDGSYGWSFYSYDPAYIQATAPYSTPFTDPAALVKDETDFTTRLTTKAKFQYTALTAADLPGQLTVAKLTKWLPTRDATWGGYYEMHWSNDETQKVMPGTTSSTPDVVVTAGAGTPHTPPLNVPYALTSTDVVSGSDIQMASDGAVPTPTYTAHTLVHPKLRAYRMLADAANPAFTTPEASTSDVPDTTVAGPTHGDVAWAPQFAFRSRYYMIYVLARGQNTVYGTSVNSSWRRLQVCYDALSDTVLWQRSQLTEKAALFEPEP